MINRSAPQTSRPGARWLHLARMLLYVLVLAVPAGDGHWHYRSASAASAANAPGERWDSIRHQDRLRNYLLFTPASYSPDKAVPLLLVLHGGHGDPARTAEQTGFKPIAEREGFVLLYPEGIDKHWNDGRETTAGGADDVGFIAALIDRVSEQINIDSRRIYVTGISNGGMMTQRLACELPERFAAFASVVANLPVSLRAVCKPASAVNMLMINGKDDPLMPWAGGEIKKGKRVGLGGSVLSTRDSVRFWADADRCDADVKMTGLPDIDPYDKTRVERIDYSGCEKGASVVLYEIDGGGHAWPGSQVKQKLQWLTGRMSRDISASELIWAFFDKHRLE